MLNINTIRNASIPSGTIDISVIQLTIIIRTSRMRAKDTLDVAIKVARNLSITTIVNAAIE
jgi:hypothetical protein